MLSVKQACLRRQRNDSHRSGWPNASRRQRQKQPFHSVWDAITDALVIPVIRIFARGAFVRANSGWKCGSQQRDPGALFTVPCAGASSSVLQDGAKARPSDLASLHALYPRYFGDDALDIELMRNVGGKERKPSQASLEPAMPRATFEQACSPRILELPI